MLGRLQILFYARINRRGARANVMYNASLARVATVVLPVLAQPVRKDLNQFPRASLHDVLDVPRCWR